MKHTRKAKHIRERKGRHDYSLGEKSPYWAWVKVRAAGQENVEANPDNLTEEDGLYFQHEPSDGQQTKLQAIEAAMSEFTEKERKVVLFLYGGMSLSDVGAKLRVNKSAVQHILNKAREKVFTILKRNEDY